MNSLLSGFSGVANPLRLRTTGSTMFVFNRSAIAVLLPIGLLLAVVAWANLSAGSAAAPAPKLDAAHPALVAQAGRQPRKGS
jgi:hypothetical protein